MFVRRQILHRYNRMVNGQEEHRYEKESAVYEKQHKLPILQHHHKPVDKIGIKIGIFWALTVRRSGTNYKARNIKDLAKENRCAVNERHEEAVIVQTHTVSK